MAVIRGGQSGAIADVDAAARAQRVVPYDAAGNPINPGELSSHQAPVLIRQTAATAAGTTVWAIRNASPIRIVEIKKLRLELFFDGTAAATLMRYEWYKGVGATNLTGGTPVTPMLERTAQGDAVAEVREGVTGLNLPGMTIQAVGAQHVHGRVTQTTTVFAKSVVDIDWEAAGSTPIVLAQNEVFGIRLGITAVVGDNCVGFIEWDER